MLELQATPFVGDALRRLGAGGLLLAELHLQSLARYLCADVVGQVAK